MTGDGDGDGAGTGTGTGTGTGGIVVGEDGVARCRWANSAPEYRAYHDTEWGFPVSDEVRLFEKLSLEGFQAGLSWLTILRKRDAFRRAFAGFEFDRIAEFGESDVTRLLADAGIVRHRGKIEAVINNARRMVERGEAEGSLAHYVWGFEPEARSGPLDRAKPAEVSVTAESKALAKDLKRRGWRFVGPTTVYAFMQAMGLVNDHREGCAVHAQVQHARERFPRP
jgi:DNA-3-methyladenine glycosylase I